jgi:flagellar motor switch protein FliM
MPANLRVARAGTAPMPGGTYTPLLAGQLPSDAITVVENIHRSFLKSAESELAELLQEPVAMGFRESTLEPVSKALQGDDRAIELDLSPLEGSAYLLFPPSLLFRVLDIMLATPENTSSDQSRRSVTGIELYILREFFEVFAQSLRDVWAKIYPAAFIQVPPGDDTGPKLPEGDDLALILRASVILAGLTTDVCLVLPTFMARTAHLESGAPGPAKLHEHLGESMMKCLGNASLSMEAVLRGANIRIRDLLGITPGQILTIGNSEDSAFECLVNGQRQFTGALISSSGRCALRIGALSERTES